MKRLATILLSLLLVCSVLAASAETLSEYSQTINLTEDYPVFWQKDIALPLTEEPVTITVMLKRNASHPEDFTDMWWVKHVEELTNIRFEFELVESAAWNDRKTLAFTSNSYPDVFFADITQDDELLYGYDGKLIDLKPLIKEYAPNVAALYEAYPDVVKGTIHDNGAIYVIPMISYAPRSAVPHCTTINSEWLQAVDKEIPTTTDELYEVLKAFRDKDPNGNNQADEIPLTLCSEGTNNKPLNNFILYAFGFTDRMHDIIDGQYVFVPAQENYRAYLEYMHKLYAEGLLDNEFFTQDTTKKQSKLSSELVGVPNESVTALVKDYEKYVAMPALTSPVCETPVWPETSIHYQRQVATLAITDKCEHPEVVMKFMNWLITTEASLATRLGPSQQESSDGYGYTYEYTDGKHAYGATRSFPDTYASYYKYRMSQCVMFAPAYINPLVDDVVVGSDDKNNWQTKLWSDSGVYDVRRTAYSLQYKHTDDELTDLTYYMDLENYAISMHAKFIKGEVELNDATWADYLKKLGNYGLEDMITLRQAGIDRYNELPSAID